MPTRLPPTRTSTASFSLTVFGCDRDLLPVAVLQEGQCDVNESWYVACSEDLCLRSTEKNAVGKRDVFLSRATYSRYEVGIIVNTCTDMLTCCLSNREVTFRPGFEPQTIY